MRSIAFALVPCALLAISPAATTPAPKDAPAPQAADGERRICRSSVATGSRLRRTRTCLTAAEWQRRDQAAREAASEIQSRNRGAPNK